MCNTVISDFSHIAQTKLTVVSCCVSFQAEYLFKNNPDVE